MLRSVKSLTGFAIGATDGEIGKVKDIYFDDQTWKLRYLVVQTGSWLFGRKILLSPVAIQAIDWNSESFPVNLTMDQVKNSPDIDTDQPVSIQQEAELHKYYLWPQDTGGGLGFLATGMVGGVMAPGIPFEDRIMDENTNAGTLNEEGTATGTGPEPMLPGDHHLRSFKNTTGYTIHASDGEIGEVDDFLIDDLNWNMPFVVIETGNWFTGKKILNPTTGISRIEWAESAVYINQTIDSMKNRGEFDPDQLTDPDIDQTF